MNYLSGMPIYYTETALEQTSERLFPESKNRSKRILKKLIKRFGGEYRMKPAMFLANGKLYIHPANRAKVEHAIREANRNDPN